MTVSTACASGATSLGVAADLLRADAADLIVAGGYDILCRFVMRGFDALRSLTRDRVRPFDRRRSGLLLGEGAALVLMARDRDARGRRLGRLLGHASAGDGTHIAAPDPEGRGLASAIRIALAEAEVGPDDVDFVSAHGTATPLNDRIETAVLKRVLGARAGLIPMNSIKGALGHTMGAAGRRVIAVEPPRAAGERFRRATRECLLGVAAVEALLREASLGPEAIRGDETALVYVTAAAYGSSNRAFIQAIASSTLHFPYTAPSAVPAEVAIEFGLTGPYVILIGGAAATIDGLWQATLLLRRGQCRRALVLAVETFAECEDLWARGRWLVRPPLVESAACALVVPGPWRATYAPAPALSPLEALARARAGETLACAPLIALALARAAGDAGPVTLTGEWRGRRAGLAWEAH